MCAHVSAGVCGSQQRASDTPGIGIIRGCEPLGCGELNLQDQPLLTTEPSIQPCTLGLLKTSLQVIWI